MNFVRLAFQHTLRTMRTNFWLFLLLAGAHLAANAAFTAFVSFAYGILYFGSVVQPETVGWLANAPLTASLAVIVTWITFGVREPSRIINGSFYLSWLPVTVVFAWAYFLETKARRKSKMI